jgi:membrane protein implicated in regulation of membrane protease activity
LNLIARVAAVLLGVVLFIVALVFASVVFAGVAALALAAWAWIMLRGRPLTRRATRAGRAPGAKGTVVIEGEYRVEREVRRVDDDSH